MSELITSAAMPAAGLIAGTLITYLYRQRKINEMDTQIEELEGTAKSRDKKIKSLNKNLKKEKTTNEGLTGELAQRDENIETLEGHVENRGYRIDSLNADIAELRTESETTISQRDSAITELRAHLNETNDHVETLNTQIAALNQQNHEQTNRATRAETRVSELDHITSELEHEITALKAKQRAMQDDFSRLDGIGPRISSVLRSAGVKTFAKLAAKETDEIREILTASNPNLLKLSDPTSWPEQAGMAAEGEWGSLKALQGTLKEARRQEREAPPHQPETDAIHFITET
jgi:predicted flap endonuclease-1-like 5' DNA nuclease